MRRTNLMLAAALAFSVALPALAAPSGGGSVPSTSPSQQIDPAEAYREGLAALEAEDYKIAEKKFGDVLSVLPKNPEANYFMGRAKVGRGKVKGSVRYFERAIKERPTFTEAREMLALVLVDLGKPDDAREQLDALKAQAASCETEECGAGYAERLGQAIARVEAKLAAPPADGAPAEEEEGEEVSALEPAAEHASLFFSADKDGAGVYLGAVRLINEARYEEAIAELYRAQGTFGPHPDILNYLGFAHRKLGRMDAARSYYAQALALDPDHLGANEYLGELYLELGDIDAAKRQLAKLEGLCAFGCAEREDLARLIDVKQADRRAAK